MSVPEIETTGDKHVQRNETFEKVLRTYNSLIFL